MMGLPSMVGAGWLWMLAGVLLVVGVLMLIVAILGGSGAASRQDDALQILRARFARGEIDADGFTRASDALGPSTTMGTGMGSRVALVVGAGLVVAGLIAGVVGSAVNEGMGGMMGSGMMGMMGPAPTAPAGTSVTLAGARFTPGTLNVKAGESVRWFNDDAIPHTVTAADRSWDSGNLPPGGSFERRFDHPGTYHYVCLYHPWMTGSIAVAH